MGSHSRVQIRGPAKVDNRAIPAFIQVGLGQDEFAWRTYRLVHTSLYRNTCIFLIVVLMALGMWEEPTVYRKFRLSHHPHR